MTKIIRHGYSIWKKLVRLKKLYCFLLFQIQTCLTSHIHYYQSSGVRILNLPPIFCCYSSINQSVNQYIYIYIYIYRVGAQMSYVSWKLNLCGKIQILKYWLTPNYSKCIIWGHSIVLLQNNQNLETPSPFVCTCLVLISYFYSHLL